MNIVRNRSYVYDVSGVYDASDPAVAYRRDEFGLRDDCASPADIDILTIGGSTTDQRLVPFESTYQKVMQDELSRELGRNACVSNAGVDGHSTYGHVMAFRHWLPLIPRLEPKIIIFYIGLNDATVIDNGPHRFDRREDDWYTSLKRLKVVQLALWAANVAVSFYRRPAPHKAWASSRAEYDQVQLKPDTARLSAINAEKFRGRLRIMLAEAGEYGAEVMCVTQPSRMVLRKDGKSYGLRYKTAASNDKMYSGLDWDYFLRELNEVMRQECGDDRLVDLYKLPFDRSLFYDDMHTTPAGSEKVGRELSDWLLKSDLRTTLAARDLPGA